MKKIFIVEDELVFTEYLKRFLTQRGYEVYSTPSADEALQNISAMKPDLIFLDLRLDFGQITGEDLLKKLRTDFSEVKVIVCSASSAYLDKCREYAAEAYFNKPVPVRELYGTIKKLID